MKLRYRLETNPEHPDVDVLPILRQRATNKEARSIGIYDNSIGDVYSVDGSVEDRFGTRELEQKARTANETWTEPESLGQSDNETFHEPMSQV